MAHDPSFRYQPDRCCARTRDSLLLKFRRLRDLANSIQDAAEKTEFMRFVTEKSASEQDEHIGQALALIYFAWQHFMSALPNQSNRTKNKKLAALFNRAA